MFRDVQLCKVFEYVSLIVVGEGMPDNCRSEHVGKEYAAERKAEVEQVGEIAALYGV